jgi:DNA-binding transcriptional MerR regulator/methylmalonyl-CoA mutase cobalamin-binding subunit
MYTIKQASAMSGVGIPLLRAWERRYGVVRPARSASGYRLYDASDIERLRAMRILIGAGWAPQQAGSRIRDLSDPEVAVLAGPPDATAPPRGSAPAAPASSTRAADLLDRLVAAARFIDADGLESTLDDAFGAGRFEVVADTVVLPALREIGRAWERGEVSVAGEHATSQAVLRRLAMAYEAAGGADTSQPILVGLGPGTRHEFGAFAFATAARRAGLPIIYLGPDLPTEDWMSAVTERDARAVVLGIPRAADVGRAVDVLKAIRGARPHTLVAVGGSAARRVGRRIDAAVLPDGMADAVAALRGLLDMGERPSSQVPTPS